MTNSKNNSLVSKRALTPERAAYFVPMTIGLFISIIFSFVLLRPLMIKENDIYETLITYRKKASELSLIKKQYEITRRNLTKSLNQKKGLLKLIAGPSELKTLISMLNIIADSNKIIVLGLNPEPIEFSAPQTNTQTTTYPNSLTATKALNIDPLLVEEIIKYPYKIKLEGYFINLLSFIRELEDLEIITLNSSIEIDNKNQNTNSGSNKIKASFIISAYGNGKND